MSQMFNALLRAEMAKSAAAAMPALRYSVASLYSVLSDMIANPKLAGLREVERACCGGGKFNGEEDCGTVGASLCEDRDEYLFWDKVHGTQAAYRRAVLAFFNGDARDAEPINLAQLVGETSSMAPPADRLQRRRYTTHVMRRSANNQDADDCAEAERWL
uniref:GDSL esterase/lipase n=1 Tax=Arundo donax TaxID=35708 RepID=A0A0A8XN70_ARUDO